MDPSPSDLPTGALADEALIRMLCKSMLRAWNMRDANAFAAHFADEGVIVGFDGTMMAGSAAIGQYVSELFAKHQTPAFVHIIRWVRFLSRDIAIAHGVSGMPSVLTGEINPTLNAIQMITVTRQAGDWRVALFHSTPAQFHGNPEAVAEMTAELQRRLEDSAD